MEISPEVLIVSNKHDYSTDYISHQLNKLDVSYLRLNRDQFSEFNFSLFPAGQKLIGKSNNLSFEIIPSKLKSIYFRAPIYLRDTYQPDLSPDEQLSRSQWASFIRGLTVFDNVLWVNHPQATYKAEIKPYQLHVAQKIGFTIPNTIVTNADNRLDIPNEKKKLIVKTLDPAILRIGDREAFIYSNIVEIEELLNADFSDAPVILQEALIPKIDIRVTVIDKTVFAVDIKQDGKGIDKDWRLEKNNIEYTEVELPCTLQKKCIKLVKELGLKFGAIDLILHDNQYYFIEINPTGEWAWLMEKTKLEIDKELVRLLLKDCSLC
jgi:glutathione synthase/RimK-type ligase-like ATP-grasp enzyme